MLHLLFLSVRLQRKKKKRRRHYQVKTAHLHGNRCPSMHSVLEPTRQAADSITKTLGWISRRKEKVLLTAKPNYRDCITFSVTLFFTCSTVAQRDLLCSWEFNLNKDRNCEVTELRAVELNGEKRTDRKKYSGPQSITWWCHYKCRSLRKLCESLALCLEARRSQITTMHGPKKLSWNQG